MLWMGLTILAIVGIMAVNGRYSPTASGVGLGLSVLWYLFERERPTPPATEEELSKLSESLYESSTEFDLADFAAFHWVLHWRRLFQEQDMRLWPCEGEGVH